MNEVIDEKISVISSYNRESGTVMPRKIRWQGRDYIIKSVSYHHKIREGKKLLHIFHVTSGTLDFRLEHDTDSLHWTLKEVCDGTTN